MKHELNKSIYPPFSNGKGSKYRYPKSKSRCIVRSRFQIYARAKNKNTDLDFIDFSLRAPFNSKNAEYIKRGIRERIRQSSVTIVLITESTYKSEWVDWEIRESVRLGKGVVGVKLKDDSSIKIPNAIEEHGFRVVGWNHEEIRQTINEAAENR